ncbi:MAG: tetraacyldisaccharide 4'-kinase [Bacteroidales bacterium]|nr:tetraacyldisaccharide 4'-kinase [Bacteroidales bacterium]
MKIRTFFSYCLFPLTMWYAIVVFFRNLLFDIGVMKQTVPNITTIGVGNLSCGGTGKTPHVEYLLRLLADKHSTAMLSRGYKRKSTGYQADDGTHSVQLLGDEAAMVASKFKNVKVAVCKNRATGIDNLMRDNSDLSLVVLDDVFQHRGVRPSLNILLTEYDNPFFSDSILPFGNLREGRRGRLRANIIIVTKTPRNLNPIDRHNIVAALKLQTYQKVYFSYMEYGDLVPLAGGRARKLTDFTDVVCVTGIANPQPLYAYLRQNVSMVPMQFADHHNFCAEDISAMVAKLEEIEGKNRCIVTTEKDAARLRDPQFAELLNGMPVYTIGINVAFHNDDGPVFDREVEKLVGENIVYLQRLSHYRT